MASVIVASSLALLIASLNSSSITESIGTSVAPLRGLNVRVGVIESITVKVAELAVLTFPELSLTGVPMAT